MRSSGPIECGQSDDLFEFPRSGAIIPYVIPCTSTHPRCGAHTKIYIRTHTEEEGKILSLL